MTYRVMYGDLAVPASGDTTAAILYSERFSTEHEALRRAREILEEDERRTIAICDAGGNILLGGVCLQLKLGFSGD